MRITGGKAAFEHKVVCKFGGSSVADAERIRKIESIIRADGRRSYVVVSAPGKRYDSDEKITDLLYTSQSLAARGTSFSGPFKTVRERYLAIARDLGADFGIKSLLDEVETQLWSGATPDLAASRGEYLCAHLLAAYLDAEFVDAAEVIRLKEDGSVDEESYALLADRLTGHGLTLIPGFYGATSKGEIRTFSRGGSDITGALVARAVEAEVYENWTDVSGLLMADPHLVANPKPMREVTYREIRELAYMGARVFHEEAMVPVYKKRIPINIRNTNEPGDPGTMILGEREAGDHPVAGIAGKKGYGLLFFVKFLLNREPALKDRLLELLVRHGIAVEKVLSGIDSLSVIVREETLESREDLLCREIRELLSPDRLEITRDLALIAAIGEGLAHRVDLGARLFSTLAEAGINVRLTDQGSSDIDVIIGVAAADFEKTIRALYQTFS